MLIPGLKGPLTCLVNTVCLVVCDPLVGLARDGSYARRGKAPPARTADDEALFPLREPRGAGALARREEAPEREEEKEAPGLGEEGRVRVESSEGKRLTPGRGEEGRPTVPEPETRPEVDRSETAEGGSAR